MAADNPIPRAALEVVGAIFPVHRYVPHQLGGDPEQVMACGDDGLLVTVFQPSIASLDGGALCTGGRQSGLDEGRAEVTIAAPRLSTSTFASALVLPRTNPRPAAELTRTAGKVSGEAPRRIRSRWMYARATAVSTT